MKIDITFSHYLKGGEHLVSNRRSDVYTDYKRQSVMWTMESGLDKVIDDSQNDYPILLDKIYEEGKVRFNKSPRNHLGNKSYRGVL